MDIMDLVRKKRQAIQAASGRREKTHKPQSGKSRFRILPTWKTDGDPQFFRDFGQHFIKDTSDNLQAVYMCVEKTDQVPCPICQSISQGILRTKDDDIISALKDSQASGRILFNALHLDGEDPKAPLILDLSPTTAQAVFDLMDEYGNITDLAEGTDIVINREGKGLNTKYSVIAAAKSQPVDKAIMKTLHNLDEYVQQEYDEGKNKAIAAVSNVSGFITSAVAGGGSRSTPALEGPDSYDDGEYGSIPVADAEEYSEPVRATDKESVGKGSEDLTQDDLDDMLGLLDMED